MSLALPVLENIVTVMPPADDYVWLRVEAAIPTFVRSSDGTPMPRIVGEVLLLNREAGMVWLGWTGQRYVWYQVAAGE